MKLVVFNDEDFGYSKNRTRNYLLSQGHCHTLKLANLRTFLKLFYFFVPFMLPCIIFVLLSALAFESI
jgi:hypothetical protein